MRKFTLLLPVLLFALAAFAQKKGGPGSKGQMSLGSIFSQNDRKHAKYFISLSYGFGQAWWRSRLGNSEIYDLNGNIVKSGNINFHANNSTNSICLDGQVPLGKVRVGLGINFDYYFLDKLQLIDPRGNQYVPYPENFRFDKFFAQVEVPFNFQSDKFWTLSVRAHAGYFGYSYVSHFSLFGEQALAKTFFGTLGAIADFKLYPHTYLFVFPNFEYKYYDNNRMESPVRIHHNIFAWNLLFGIRIDVSKEK